MKEIFNKWKNRTTLPENSIPFRLTVLLAILTAVIAALKDLEWPDYSIMVVFSTIIGFIFSYWRRGQKNWWVALSLSCCLLWFFIKFWGNLMASPYDPRIPLISLLLWMQCLHSFDLPQRKDLKYSILVSLILIVFSAAMDRSAAYLPILTVYIFFATLCLLYNYFSEITETSPELKPPSVKWMVTKAFVISLGIILLGGLISTFLPKLEGFKVRFLPISWAINLPKISFGRIINPAYPGASGDDWDERRLRATIDPFNYFGFSPNLDLNYRGKLSSEIVMRVKTNHPSYYRGVPFRLYNGHSWEISDEPVKELMSVNPPFTVIYPGRVDNPRYPLFYWLEPDREIVQIFYVEREMPNVIFASLRPYLLYFPSSNIYMDRDLGLRGPFQMEKGMIYSCISLQKKFDWSQLKQTIPSGYRSNYPELFQLPSLSPRVWELSRKLTKGLPNPYEKSIAILNYLRNNCIYDLNIPPFPQDAECVDYFLFEQKRGYCEHFATAMAVLLRCSGIPCRMLTGYTSGTYNPFTTFYEIKANDAHAWVEALLPNVGWVTFEPTPGNLAIPQVMAKNEQWLLMEFWSYFNNHWHDEWSEKLGSMIVKIPLLDRLLSLKTPIVIGLLTLFASLFVLLFLLLWQGKLPKLRGKTLKLNHPVFRLYLNMLRILARKGYRLKASQTPQEFAGQFASGPLGEMVAVLTSLFYQAAYSQKIIEKDSLEKGRKIFQEFKAQSKNLKPYAK